MDNTMGHGAEATRPFGLVSFDPGLGSNRGDLWKSERTSGDQHGQ